MLLTPIQIKSESNSDIKDKGNSLPASGPEAGCGPETASCREIQESTTRDSTVQKAGQPSTTLTVSQSQNKEVNNGPERNRLFLITKEESHKKKAMSWSCKQKFFDISLFKNPFFSIFTWTFLLSQLAYFIPTFHLVARAKTLGIDIMDASYLISVAGKKAYFNLTLKGKMNLVLQKCIKFYLKAEERQFFKKGVVKDQEK